MHIYEKQSFILMICTENKTITNYVLTSWGRK